MSAELVNPPDSFDADFRKGYATRSEGLHEGVHGPKQSSLVHAEPIAIKPPEKVETGKSSPAGADGKTEGIDQAEAEAKIERFYQSEVEVEAKAPTIGKPKQIIYSACESLGSYISGYLGDLDRLRAADEQSVHDGSAPAEGELSRARAELRLATVELKRDLEASIGVLQSVLRSEDKPKILLAEPVSYVSGELVEGCVEALLRGSTGNHEKAEDMLGFLAEHKAPEKVGEFVLSTSLLRQGYALFKASNELNGYINREYKKDEKPGERDFGLESVLTMAQKLIAYDHAIKQSAGGTITTDEERRNTVAQSQNSLDRFIKVLVENVKAYNADRTVSS